MDLYNLLGSHISYAGDISFGISAFVVLLVAVFHDSFKDPGKTLRYTALIGLITTLVVIFSVGIDVPTQKILNNSYINDTFAIGGKMALLMCGIFSCVFNRVDETIKLSNYIFYPLLKIAMVGGFIALSAIGLDILLLASGLIMISTSVMIVLSSADRLYSKTNSVYLISQAVGLSIFSLGVVYMYSILGTVQYEAMKITIASNSVFEKNLLLSLVLIISAIGCLMGAVPFSNWVVKIHTSVLDSVAVFLRTGVVVVYILVLARLLYDPFASTALIWKDFILFIGVFGVLIGTMGTLTQQKIDKLYGYGSIGHVGFLFLALGIGNVNSISAIVIYCIAYIFSYVAFLGYGRGVLADGALVSKLEDLSGSGRSMGLHSLCFAIAGLSFAGLPPFIGFIGKVSVLGAVLQWDLPFVVMVLVISGVLQSIWVLRLFRVMYFTNYKVGECKAKGVKIIFANKAQKGMVLVRRFAIIISILSLFISAPLMAVAYQMASVF